MWDPPEPGIKPMSPALAGGPQPLDHQGRPIDYFIVNNFYLLIPNPSLIPPTSLYSLVIINLFSVFVNLSFVIFISLLFFLDSTYK